MWPCLCPGCSVCLCAPLRGPCQQSPPTLRMNRTPGVSWPLAASGVARCPLESEADCLWKIISDNHTGPSLALHKVSLASLHGRQHFLEGLELNPPKGCALFLQSGYDSGIISGIISAITRLSSRFAGADFNSSSPYFPCLDRWNLEFWRQSRRTLSDHTLCVFSYSERSND